MFSSSLSSQMTRTPGAYFSSERTSRITSASVTFGTERSRPTPTTMQQYASARLIRARSASFHGDPRITMTSSKSAISAQSESAGACGIRKMMVRCTARCSARSVVTKWRMSRKEWHTITTWSERSSGTTILMAEVRLFRSAVSLDRRCRSCGSRGAVLSHDSGIHSSASALAASLVLASSGAARAALSPPPSAPTPAAAPAASDSGKGGAAFASSAPPASPPAAAASRFVAADTFFSAGSSSAAESFASSARATKIFRDGPTRGTNVCCGLESLKLCSDVSLRRILVLVDNTGVEWSPAGDDVEAAAAADPRALPPPPLPPPPLGGGGFIGVCPFDSCGESLSTAAADSAPSPLSFAPSPPPRPLAVGSNPRRDSPPSAAFAPSSSSVTVSYFSWTAPTLLLSFAINREMRLKNPLPGLPSSPSSLPSLSYSNSSMAASASSAMTNPTSRDLMM
mmetsp:Transcript_1431/g.5273  ORF Transcript_1431/g.5273 Transcript_1431/m.5273 type:complete len:455 (+) Transcript_1431:555-1919(+)